MLTVSLTLKPMMPVPLDRQPTLSDGVVELRPLRPEDRDALAGAASDPLIWAGHPDTERYGPTFPAFFAASLASGGGLVIAHVDNGELIGHTRVEPLPDADDAVEVGWTFLTRAHWGGATNRRVKRLLVAHAAAAGQRVVLHIAGENGRSRAAAERLGGTTLGADDPARWRSGKPHYVSVLLPEAIP